MKILLVGINQLENEIFQQYFHNNIKEILMINDYNLIDEKIQNFQPNWIIIIDNPFLKEIQNKTIKKLQEKGYSTYLFNYDDNKMMEKYLFINEI